ncbi:MAG TPA: hypothetical protein VEC06_07155 [Paucimonas sp.]|nr:hypothetical protein [Paucimonas sp.]
MRRVLRTLGAGILLAGSAVAPVASASDQSGGELESGWSAGLSHDFSEGRYGTGFDTKSSTTSLNID